jgi:hypothetical protein
VSTYNPMRRLATGGMAEVFLAVQRGIEGFEKLVVLKQILPQRIRKTRPIWKQISQ